MTVPPHRIVVADANVLINLIHTARLDFCWRLANFEFVVPDHVREEITIPAQRTKLDQAVEGGQLRLVSMTEPGDIELFADLVSFLGRGEAACLVLAVRNGWLVASDEKRRFRREVAKRIGDDRLIGTADLYIRAIRSGLVTIEEANADKASLEMRRFRMPFGSFREVVGDEP